MTGSYETTTVSKPMNKFYSVSTTDMEKEKSKILPGGKDDKGGKINETLKKKKNLEKIFGIQCSQNWKKHLETNIHNDLK
jgi:hypothetical protein